MCTCKLCTCYMCMHMCELSEIQYARLGATHTSQALSFFSGLPLSHLTLARLVPCLCSCSCMANPSCALDHPFPALPTLPAFRVPTVPTLPRLPTLAALPSLPTLQGKSAA